MAKRREVLIVSKTKLGNGACVGGILKKLDGSYLSVRLLPPYSYNNPKDKFNIGEVWEMDVTRKNGRIPPHLEDIVYTNEIRKGGIQNLPKFIRDNLTVFQGALSTLYDGYLRLSGSSKGYIARDIGVPNYSTLFWEADMPLLYQEPWSKPHYHYVSWPESCLIPYKGFKEPIQEINAGTIVRISLARWHPNDAPQEEQKCWLQVSGWY